MSGSESLATLLPGLSLARRAKEVTGLLVRFGFGEFVELSGLREASRRARVILS